MSDETKSGIRADVFTYVGMAFSFLTLFTGSDSSINVKWLYIMGLTIAAGFLLTGLIFGLKGFKHSKLINDEEMKRRSLTGLMMGPFFLILTIVFGIIFFLRP